MALLSLPGSIVLTAAGVLGFLAAHRGNVKYAKWYFQLMTVYIGYSVSTMIIAAIEGMPNEVCELEGEFTREQCMKSMHGVFWVMFAGYVFISLTICGACAFCAFRFWQDLLASPRTDGYIVYDGEMLASDPEVGYMPANQTAQQGQPLEVYYETPVYGSPQRIDVSPQQPFGQAQNFVQAQPFGQAQNFVQAQPFGQAQNIVPAENFGQTSSVHAPVSPLPVQHFGPAQDFGQTEQVYGQQPPISFLPQQHVEPQTNVRAETQQQPQTQKVFFDIE